MGACRDSAQDLERFFPSSYLVIYSNMTLVGLKEHLESIVPVLSMAILTSAWVESDATVQAVMWEPLLLFLKGG